jgi:hypothetical protein
MKISITIPAYLALAAVLPGAVWAEEGADFPRSSEAKVVWVRDEPTCPLTDGRMDNDIDDPDLYPFKVDGDVSEPVLKSRIRDNGWTEEELDCYRNGIGLPVYQLVINGDGVVEEIVRVREQPECWTRVMVDILRDCRFDPATRNVEPVCVVYIMTLRFHPY